MIIRFRKLRNQVTSILSISIIGLLSLGSLMVINPVSAATVSLPANCNDAANEVIWCGVSTVSAIQHDYINGDGHNSAASIQAIYKYFKIDHAAINSMSNTAVAGSVTKSGDVLVNGKVVATSAITGGRQNMPGSTAVTSGNTTFYKRPPSVSFTSNSLDAFVVMRSGSFWFAILSSCGNAVTAVPKVSTPKPTAVVQPTAPKTTPNYTISKQVEINGTNTWSYEVQVHPGAQVNYRIIVTSTGSAKVNNLMVKDILPNDDTYTANSLSLNGSQMTAANASQLFGGGYQAVSALPPGSTLTFIFSATVGQNQNNANCTNETLPNVATMQGSQLPQESSTATVSVVCVPAKPTTTTSAPRAPALVNTGPGSIIGIFVGSSLAGAVGYGWYMKRRLYNK